MEGVLATAGLIGLVAGTNGIIGLCEKAVSLLDHVRRTDELETEHARIGNICGVYLKLQDKLELEKDDMEASDLQLLRLSTVVVQSKMTKILEKLQLSGSGVVISQKKSINKNLKEIDRVLDSYVRNLLLKAQPATKKFAVSMSNRTATERSDVANLLVSHKLLQRLLDPSNRKIIPKSTLRRQEWYSETLEVQPNNARRVEVVGKTYIVERIALGRTPKETDQRLSRLGKLLMIMRESADEDICNLLRMSIIVREPDSFCILSELEDASYTVLEDMLPSLRCDRGQKVMLLIAEAVQSLHKMSLVHEGLNSQNILVHRDSLRIKLTGFASSREYLDLSDCATILTPEDPDFQKRYKIFQAPERLAGSRYSFECDVYSLGIVMTEVCIGRPLVQETSEVGREDIMCLVEQCSQVTMAGTDQPQVVALIRDIVLAETASKRPVAVEITDRLSRMGGH